MAKAKAKVNIELEKKNNDKRFIIDKNYIILFKVVFDLDQFDNIEISLIYNCSSPIHTCLPSNYELNSGHLVIIMLGAIVTIMQSVNVRCMMLCKLYEMDMKSANILMWNCTSC